jgi:hypothetical protein
MAVTYTNRKGYRKYKHYIGTLCSQAFVPGPPVTRRRVTGSSWIAKLRLAQEGRAPLVPSCQNDVSSWIKLAAAARGGADYGLLARNGQVAYNWKLIN